MARPLRLEFPGALYHLTARGNAPQDMSVDDRDRHRLLQLREREILQQGWRCSASCVMANHSHLLLETPEANLVGGMCRVNRAYAQTCNRRHHRIGHLCQGRSTSMVVERDHYRVELGRSMVRNPVRAGLVTQAGD